MEGEQPVQARRANCGTALAGEWCHACGQKRYVEGDRRLGHLLGEAWRVMTDLDGRFWGSLGALLFQAADRRDAAGPLQRQCSPSP